MPSPEGKAFIDGWNDNIDECIGHLKKKPTQSMILATKKPKLHGKAEVFMYICIGHWYHHRDGSACGKALQETPGSQ